MYISPNTYNNLTSRRSDGGKCHASLLDWSANHRTIIIKNGGTDLSGLATFLQEKHPYPYAVFREESLADTITAVGIILPEKFYKAMPNPEGFTTWEWRLKQLYLDLTPLA